MFKRHNYKFDLKNFEKSAWICAHANDSDLIPLWFSQRKTLLGEGIRALRILFLKMPKRFEFGRARSKLFHSKIVGGKKEFLNNFCLIS